MIDLFMVDSSSLLNAFHYLNKSIVRLFIQFLFNLLNHKISPQFLIAISLLEKSSSEC